MKEGLFVLASLFTVRTPTAEKIKILDQYFTPKSGSLLKVDSDSNLDAQSHFLDAPLHLKVEPPKGSCFNLSHIYGVDVPDLHTCKKSTVFFKLKEIDAAGRLQLNVITSRRDSGTILSWQTPYRMARVTDLGQANSTKRRRIPIKDCRVVGPKRIDLELFDGKIWSIKFPKKDVSADKEEKNYPDYLDKKNQSETSENGSVMSEIIDKYDDESNEDKSASALKYKFILPYKNSYEMTADHVSTSNFNSGIRGMCRYRYKNAIDDPLSGILECYNLDNYDSLMVSLSCSKNLIKE